jgi:hypothetical protein
MSNEKRRIDLTQFEKITHDILSFTVMINGEETTEYQRSDLWDTWILNEQQAAEGKALAVFTMDLQNPVCLIEGYETAEEGLANAKAIAHLPKIIAELKECYEKIDRMGLALENAVCEIDELKNGPIEPASE